jgi:hypothetical protein
LSLATGLSISRPTASIETVRRVLLWLTVFSGFFVMVEPAPYEIFAVLTIFLFVVSGLRFRRELLPLLLLLTLWHFGAGMALIQVAHLPKTTMWTLVGVFLAMTAFFFALCVADAPEARLRTIIKAWIAGAVAVSLIAIAGYFRVLPNSDELLLYGRAKGTFKDPNVFGPFLVLPGLVLIQRFYIEGKRAGLLAAGLLLIIIAALFLSFSRAAWGNFAACVALMTGLTLLIVQRPAERARILLVAAVGVIGMLLILAALLMVPQVQSLFEERASLSQSYDSGHLGRFGRHLLGFQLALERPFGIGMLQFGKMFGEDPHNTFLNGFMSYGWLGGLTYPTLIILTLVIGYRTVLVPTPWRPVFICVLSTFTVLASMSWIIDIDHWRHLYLLLGLVWGLATASSRFQKRRIAAALRPEVAA